MQIRDVLGWIACGIGAGFEQGLDFLAAKSSAIDQKEIIKKDAFFVDVGGKGAASEPGVIPPISA